MSDTRTCPAHLTLFDLIILIIRVLGEECKLKLLIR
jgi:hypothetical protein